MQVGSHQVLEVSASLPAVVSIDRPLAHGGLISQLNNNVRKPVNNLRANINDCYNRKPDSIVEDIVSSTDHDEESTIFNERPHHKHNDSSVSSQRMRHINTVEVPGASMIDLEAIHCISSNANKSRPSRAFISNMVSH